MEDNDDDPGAIRACLDVELAKLPRRIVVKYPEKKFPSRFATRFSGRGVVKFPKRNDARFQKKPVTKFPGRAVVKYPEKKFPGKPVAKKKKVVEKCRDKKKQHY